MDCGRVEIVGGIYAGMSGDVRREMGPQCQVSVSKGGRQTLTWIYSKNLKFDNERAVDACSEKSSSTPRSNTDEQEMRAQASRGNGEEMKDQEKMPPMNLSWKKKKEDIVAEDIDEKEETKKQSHHAGVFAELNARLLKKDVIVPQEVDEQGEKEKQGEHANVFAELRKKLRTPVGKERSTAEPSTRSGDAQKLRTPEGKERSTAEPAIRSGEAQKLRTPVGKERSTAEQSTRTGEAQKPRTPEGKESSIAEPSIRAGEAQKTQTPEGRESSIAEPTILAGEAQEPQTPEGKEPSTAEPAIRSGEAQEPQTPEGKESSIAEPTTRAGEAQNPTVIGEAGAETSVTEGKVPPIALAGHEAPVALGGDAPSVAEPSGDMDAESAVVPKSLDEPKINPRRARRTADGRTRSPRATRTAVAKKSEELPTNDGPGDGEKMLSIESPNSSSPPQTRKLPNRLKICFKELADQADDEPVKTPVARPERLTGWAARQKRIERRLQREKDMEIDEDCGASGVSEDERGNVRPADGNVRPADVVDRRQEAQQEQHASAPPASCTTEDCAEVPPIVNPASRPPAKTVPDATVVGALVGNSDHSDIAAHKCSTKEIGNPPHTAPDASENADVSRIVPPAPPAPPETVPDVSVGGALVGNSDAAHECSRKGVVNPPDTAPDASENADAHALAGAEASSAVRTHEESMASGGDGHTTTHDHTDHIEVCSRRQSSEEEPQGGILDQYGSREVRVGLEGSQDDEPERNGGVSMDVAERSDAPVATIADAAGLGIDEARMGKDVGNGAQEEAVIAAPTSRGDKELPEENVRTLRTNTRQTIVENRMETLVDEVGLLRKQLVAMESMKKGTSTQEEAIMVDVACQTELFLLEAYLLSRFAITTKVGEKVEGEEMCTQTDFRGDRRKSTCRSVGFSIPDDVNELSELDSMIDRPEPKRLVSDDESNVDRSAAKLRQNQEVATDRGEAPEVVSTITKELDSNIEDEAEVLVFQNCIIECAEWSQATELFTTPVRHLGPEGGADQANFFGAKARRNTLLRSSSTMEEWKCWASAYLSTFSSEKDGDDGAEDVASMDRVTFAQGEDAKSNEEEMPSNIDLKSLAVNRDDDEESEWKTVWSSEYQRCYYWNPSTDAVSWIQPVLEE